MSTISLKDAKSFSNVIDRAATGEFVTIARHGRHAAVLVSVDAAEAAKRALGKEPRPSFIDYLARFPAEANLDDEVFARDPVPSRKVDL